MTAVALSLAAALTWGCSDFAAGLKSRRWPVPVVLAWAESAGLVVALGIIVAVAEPFPDGRSTAFSLLAGACGLIGLSAFYRALAVGRMSIVAPLSATGVVLPVVIGVATGDQLGAVVAVGLVIIVLGAIAATREEEDPARRVVGHRESILLALAAALGFGGYFALGDVAADGSILWLLALARVAMLPLVLLTVRRIRAPRLPGRERLALCVIGCGDLAATALYALATTRGALAVVAVVGSLYPVTTVILARFVLDERLSRLQLAGVVTAFAGVGMVSAG